MDEYINLDQVEADIGLCEEFLVRDQSRGGQRAGDGSSTHQQSFNPAGITATHTDSYTYTIDDEPDHVLRAEASRQSDDDVTLPLDNDAGDYEDGRDGLVYDRCSAPRHGGRSGLTEQQRAEILSRLAAERAARRKRVLAGAMGQEPNRRDFYEPLGKTAEDAADDRYAGRAELQDSGMGAFGGFGPSGAPQLGKLMSPSSSVASNSRPPTPGSTFDMGRGMGAIDVQRPDSPKGIDLDHGAYGMDPYAAGAPYSGMDEGYDGYGSQEQAELYGRGAYESAGQQAPRPDEVVHNIARGEHPVSRDVNSIDIGGAFETGFNNADPDDEYLSESEITDSRASYDSPAYREYGGTPSTNDLYRGEGEGMDSAGAGMAGAGMGGGRSAAAVGSTAKPRPASARPSSASRSRPKPPQPKPTPAWRSGGSAGGAGAAARARPSSAPRERTNPEKKLTRTQTAPANPKNRHSREAIAQAVNAEKDANLTFKPTINKRKPVASSDQSKGAEGSQRLSQLAQPRMMDKWIAERQKAEQEDLKDCTFKPQTGRAPYHADHTAVPASHRLYNQSDSKFLARERAKRELEEAEVTSCPFKPKINQYKARGYKPLQNRLADLQRQKSEKLARARMAAEMQDPDLTFQPKLNQTSMRIVEVLEEREGEVGERLSGTAPNVAMDRRMRKQAELESAIHEECTFQPTISQTSERMIEVMQGYGRNPDFITRQEELHREALEKKYVLAEAGDEECTFEPSLGNAADIVTHSRYGTSIAVETQAEKMERLSFKDAMRKDSLKENLQRQFYSQYKYKPKLSAASREMGAPTPLSELVRNKRGESVREKMKREQEEQERAECTFQPNINPESQKLAAPRPNQMKMAQPETIVRRINGYKKEREDRLNECRAEKEYEELQECTFTPAVNASKAATKDSKPVVVRGLGRYLELQELAKKQKQETEERYQKAFLTNPTGQRPQQYTVPEPFNLDHADREARAEARKSQIANELQLKRDGECTFKPKTLHGQNKQLIQDILNNEDDYM